MAGTVWLQLYGCTAVLYGTCTRMARILLDLSIVLYGGTGTTVRLYGTVWLYSCMVLYGQYTTRSSRILLLVDLVGILMPSAECMGLYRGGLLSNRSELDAMGGMPLGV